METNLDIQEIQVEGDPCLVVNGDIDMHSSPILSERLRGLLGQAPPRLWLDLSQLRHLDSTGIALLLSALASQRKHRRRLILWRVPERVQKVFCILGLGFLIDQA